MIGVSHCSTNISHHVVIYLIGFYIILKNISHKIIFLHKRTTSKVVLDIKKCFSKKHGGKSESSSHVHTIGLSVGEQPPSVGDQPPSVGDQRPSVDDQPPLSNLESGFQTRHSFFPTLSKE